LHGIADEIAICLLLFSCIVTPLGYALETDDSQRVIEPVVECDGITVNATSYRLNNEQTLNFTFIFFTNGTAEASFTKNVTELMNKTYWGIYTASMSSSTFVDGVRRSYGYNSLGRSDVAGLSGHYVSTGSSRTKEISQILFGGTHEIKHVILFKIDGDAEGYFDINFLSPMTLTVEEFDPGPFAWWHYLLFGTGIGTAATITVGIVLFRRKQLKNVQKPPPKPAPTA